MLEKQKKCRKKRKEKSKKFLSVLTLEIKLIKDLFLASLSLLLLPCLVIYFNFNRFFCQLNKTLNRSVYKYVVDWFSFGNICWLFEPRDNFRIRITGWNTSCMCWDYAKFIDGQGFGKINVLREDSNESPSKTPPNHPNQVVKTWQISHLKFHMINHIYDTERKMLFVLDPTISLKTAHKCLKLENASWEIFVTKIARKFHERIVLWQRMC